MNGFARKTVKNIEAPTYERMVEMRTVAERRKDGMIYYGMSPINPDGVLAHLGCDLIAHAIAKCGYPSCGETVDACVVHPLRGKAFEWEDWMQIYCKISTALDKCELIGCKEHKTKSRFEGVSFLPVCERHKGWELAKVSDVQGWDAVWE